MKTLVNDEKRELELLGKAVLRRYEHIKDLADGPEWQALRKMQNQYNDLRFRVEVKGVPAQRGRGHAKAVAR